jgi:sulfoquinovose isomerase
MVEAFLAAGDATGDGAWHELAELVIGRFARLRDWRVLEHVDADWNPLPDYNRDDPRHRFRPFGVTPGHGLEWSRLLLQLRSALTTPPDWLLDAARGLFERALWDFAATYLLDRRGGNWHHELDETLQPSERTWTGKPDVYHAFQATLIPRLPPRPSLAGALREYALA